MEGRLCHLKYFQLPQYWKEIVESIASAEHAIIRLREIEDSHVAREGEHISLYIEDSNGDKLHIGLAGDVWMITHLHPVDECDVEYQFAVGDKEAEGSVPFLFPEWTDVTAKRLISKSKGQAIVREWIERGILSNSIEWTYDLL